MKTIRASHIVIGTELTSGQTQNTNSRTIAEFLQEMGIKNQMHIVVPDDRKLIMQSFDFADPETDWFFVYGGLGPTTDDFTRDMVSEWSGKNLILNDSVWLHVQNLLRQRGVIVRDFQRQQALFPEGAHVMENSKGTAHGFHLTARGKEIFVLPGPPKEVQSVFENYLRSWVQTHSQTSDSEITEIWNTMGVGESEVAYQVEALVKDYEVVVGYRVHIPYVEVKITYLKSQLQKNRPLVDAISNKLAPILVYKNKYPYPDFFKTFFETRPALTLIDEYSQGGILTDFQKWIGQWDKQTVAYFNHPVSTMLTPKGPLPPHMARISITRSQTSNAIAIVVKSDTLELDFEISLEPYVKTVPERKPIVLKEVIYKELMTRISGHHK